MRLTKIYIENFGVLRDYSYVPTAGFNQIYGENGTGKSTLAAFIKAMFFGMPQTRTRKLLDEAERKKFKSWQGGSCGGYICFEENGKEYRVTRTFGDRESEDTFSLTDESTGIISKDYSSDIGREIFGIDREAFGSTIWIAAKNMPVAVNDSIHAKLSLSGENGTTTLERDIDNYDKGVEKLNEAYKQYMRTGRRGLIYEAEDEIADLKLQIEEKQKRLHAVEGMIESLNKRIESRYMSAVSSDVRKMDDAGWRKRLEWLDDYFSKGMPEEGELDSNIAANERKLQMLNSDIENHKRQRRSSKRMIAILAVPLALSLCAIAAALIMLFMMKDGVVQIGGVKAEHTNMTAFIVTFVTGAAAFVLFGIWLKVIISRFNKIKASIEELVYQTEQLKKANEHLREQRSLVAEYSYLSEKDMYRAKLEKQLDVQKYQLELNNYCKEQDTINSDIVNLRHNISRKQEMLKKYQYNAEIIKKTCQYLTDARNGYVLGYKDLIAGKMADYLSCFDEKLADSLRLNADFIVSIAVGAADRDIDYFSSGIKDIIWFCERIAIIDVIFGEKSFIIMDDTFINMDDNMVCKALELTAQLAKNRQVIYMTCRKSNMYRKKD